MRSATSQSNRDMSSAEPSLPSRLLDAACGIAGRGGLPVLRVVRDVQEPVLPRLELRPLRLRRVRICRAECGLELSRDRGKHLQKSRHPP